MIDFPHASLCYLTEPGTNMESLMCDASTAISVALQNGATPQELAHSITRNPDGTPASPIGQILDDMVMG